MQSIPHRQLQPTATAVCRYQLSMIIELSRTIESSAHQVRIEYRMIAWKHNRNEMGMFDVCFNKEQKTGDSSKEISRVDERALSPGISQCYQPSSLNSQLIAHVTAYSSYLNTSVYTRPE